MTVAFFMSSFKLTIWSLAQEEMEHQEPEESMHGAVAD